jgi:hypothetical protein
LFRSGTCFGISAVIHLQASASSFGFVRWCSGGIAGDLIASSRRRDGVRAAAAGGLDNPRVELWGFGFLFVAGSERIPAAVARGRSARVAFG